MNIVVDTSVIVKWLVVEDGHEDALTLLDSGQRLLCPDLALAETANVMRRKVRASAVSFDQASEALARLHLFFDRIVPSAELAAAGFSLAEKLDHSVYDCLFVALAQRETNTVLVTADNVFLKKCIVAGLGQGIRFLRDHAAFIQEKANPSHG